MDIELVEIDGVNAVASGHGKMMFVYQSKEMKNLYERYGNHMILLDATYKTTKHALPLLFVGVPTNVSFQVCCVIVLQEESTEMIIKALKIFKEWNPMVSPKYAFVDFDELEITSLEKVFERVKVFLCDFHREQAWHRWTSKTEKGFSHASDQVKTRLRHIAHSTTHAHCQSAVKELMRGSVLVKEN